jgi:hypothetical protein
VQLGGPLVVVWDNLNTHTSHAMAELIATRDWLRACQLPPCAHELNPGRAILSKATLGVFGPLPGDQHLGVTRPFPEPACRRGGDEQLAQFRGELFQPWAE